MTNWNKPIILGYAVIILFFGFGGVWAYFAPLNAAVMGPGTIAAQSNKKTIQHFEGGIIREINVRDGDLVEKDQLLFRLDDTQAKAQLELQRIQLAASLTKEARLLAERRGILDLALPSEVQLLRGNPKIEQAISDEIESLSQRKGVLNAQINTQKNRIVQYERELEGLAAENNSASQQIKFLDAELPGLRGLFDQRLVPLARVTTLERERARLEGIVARATTDSAKAKGNIAETEFQITQLQATFQQGVASEILETRKIIADTREKTSIAEDILRRTEIRAPQAGVAQGRKFNGIGNVVRPGEPLVDIAPIGENMVILAQVNPRDVHVLKRGLATAITFPGFKSTETPFMSGAVLSLSYDRLTDPANNNRSYFAVEVAVDPASVPDHIRTQLVPGMEAEVAIATGERSALRYFLAPLEERLRRSFRER